MTQIKQGLCMYSTNQAMYTSVSTWRACMGTDATVELDIGKALGTSVLYTGR